MKQTINFMFSIGYRCYSTNFLKLYNLRKLSSPFDYLFIDFETSLKIINNKFIDYLHDIVLFNKRDNKVELFYKKNTDKINNMFFKLLENNLNYMENNYNDKDLLFNQNYIEDNILSNNIYNWKSICCFLNHNIIDNNVYNKIKDRCENFNYIMDKYNETTALFYITKIVNCENILDYINKIIDLKKIYEINCYLIIIINSDTIEENVYHKDSDKCLFIIKSVENYETQYSKYKTDNNLNYEKEFTILSEYFDFDLFEKKDI